jgi:hypothetical protein
MTTKRITTDEAKTSFFPKPSSWSLNKNTYFTLTQDEKDPTIDHVHYWVERATFDANLSFNEGYIYVLENHGIPGVLKIGYTDRSVQDRVREINSSAGVITPWYSVSHFHCKSPKHIETLVHQSLNNHRVNKEGFNVSLKQAKKVIENVIEENNASID